MDDRENVIVSYTDKQAVADGVLVRISSEGNVNRVSRAVFDHFTQPMGSSQLTGPVTNVTNLMEAIHAVLKIPADSDGWRALTYQGRELWLLPNETGGLSLMFPEDY